MLRTERCGNQSGATSAGWTNMARHDSTVLFPTIFGSRQGGMLAGVNERTGLIAEKLTPGDL